MTIFLVVLIGFTVLVLSVLFTDFTLTIKNGIGYVSQDTKRTAIKEIIKEEDGCVYWVGVWGEDGKTCGSYSIELLK